MLLTIKRKLVYFVVDDTVYTVMKSAAGSGEGLPPNEQQYVVLMEDAHGETSVWVTTKVSLFSIIPEHKEYQKTLIQNSINEL